MNINKKLIVFTTASIILMLAAFSLGLNSSQKTEIKKTAIAKTDTSGSVKKYHFSTWENGTRIRWKAVLKDDDIIFLYRNDVQIPADEINKYKDMVNDKIEDSDYLLSSIDFQMPDIDIHFDKDQFNLQMDKLREKLKNMKSFRFDFKFDRNQFEKDMQKMNDNLKNMQDCRIFDKVEFQKMMDSVSKSVEKSLENININIDMDAINKSMENVHMQMKDLKIDMSKLKEQMRHLKEFLKDMRSELIKDGYLDDSDENFDMSFNKNELIINGRKLPDNLLEKYKKIYRDHFGKEINDRFRLIN